MEKTYNVTIEPLQKPARRLIYLPSLQGEDYFSYCEEKGCDWEPFFNEIPEKLDRAALVTFPPGVDLGEYSKVASGVEVPLTYDATLPEGFFMMDLPQEDMLCFLSDPYEAEEDFFPAIDAVFEAIEHYDHEKNGYRPSQGPSPQFNFGSTEDKRARICLPVQTVIT